MQNLHGGNNVIKTPASSSEDVGSFNLGYGRLEVLAVFSSSVLAELAGMFYVKEALERLLEPEEIHT